MASEPLQFFTPVGRMTHGSVVEKDTKDNDGRPIPPDEQRYEIGVAFPKADLWPLLTEQFWPYLSRELASDQNGLQRMQQWFQQPGAKGIFSMKITDGDLANSRGQTNENTKGCFVMWFRFIDVATVGPNNEDIDPAAIKRGFYVQVAGNIKPNGQPNDRAGIYLNGNIVRLVGEGDEIRGGMDAETAFGGVAPPALPPGARPVGSSSGASGAFGGSTPPPSAPAPAGTAPAAPPAPGAPPAAPGGTASPTDGVQPHTGILNGPPPLPGI